MKIEVILDKNVYRPNENVAGRIEFSEPLIGDVKGFKLVAKGEEKTRIVGTQEVVVPAEVQDKDKDGFPDPPGPNRIQTETVALEEYDVFFRKEVELSSLTSPAKFEFTLPPDARSSYQGKYAWVTYELRAIADIWGPFDPAKAVEFKVLIPDQAPTSGTKVTFDQRRDDLHVIMELQKNVFTPGENITGNIMIENPSNKDIKNIEIILKGIEVANAKNASRRTTIQEYKKKINWNDSTISFDIQIPKEVIRRYSGKYFGYYWELVLRIDLGFFSGVMSISRGIEII
jgi:Arrestin (or S-antigen), C-terminal domain/Arrestin (or S-antigen), N-terminal domain